MEHLLLVGANIDAEVANKLVAVFYNLGTTFILKELKCIVKLHTSEWYPLICRDKQ